jgi:hypothetical protein
MEPRIRGLVEAIHRTARKCVLAMTGGGAEAAGLLLSVPGGSRTVLEVVVPYDERALVEYLGRVPEQFCSAATTREMADRAYARVGWLAAGEAVIGLGCTASLATDRPKRGDHRFHVAVRTGDRITTYSLTLQKGARDREAEEAILDAILLNALTEAMDIAERVPLALLPDEAVQVEASATDPVHALLRNEVATVCAEIDGRLTRDASRPAALLPGSFNPVHEGHLRLASVAAAELGGPVAFELSVTNVDKPPLVHEEIRRRLQPFAWRAPVWLTRAPTFVEKASLFPGVVFVVGADTAERIVAPRYYQESEARLLEALEQIRVQGCRFLVAGREDRQGRFLGPDDLAIPDAYRGLFQAIPRSKFDVRISSTALRERESNSASSGEPQATA